MRRSLAFILSLALSCVVAACASDGDGLALGTRSSALSMSREQQLATFAQQLAVTRDVSANLGTIVETSALKGACDRHFARLGTDERLPDASLQNAEHVSDMVRCGKWLFFNADLPSVVPTPEIFIPAVSNVFPNEAGPAMSKVGLLPNPDEPGFPLGFVRLQGNPYGAVGAITGPPRGLTCAACHVGQMADGRYAVGMPNQKLDLSALNRIAFYVAWRADYHKYDDAYWPQQLQDYYRGLDRKLAWSFSPYRALFDGALLIAWLRVTEPFLEWGNVLRPIQSEATSYLPSRPNQFYASSPLLPISDRQFFTSVPQIWDLEHYDGDVTDGRAAPLSPLLPSPSLESFVRMAFVIQSGNTAFSTPKYVDAVAVYLRTLKTPKNPAQQAADLVAAGESTFRARCASCHQGARGETLDPVAPELLGSPRAMLNPFYDYDPPHKVAKTVYDGVVAVSGPIPFAEGVYSRPLAGIWTRKNLMQNGSVDDLEHAFCLSRPRGPTQDASNPRTDAVHMDLCTDYSDAQKRELVAFLRAWD